MGRIIPYIMENNKCSKPPTSIYIYYVNIVYTCIYIYIYIYQYNLCNKPEKSENETAALELTGVL